MNNKLLSYLTATSGLILLSTPVFANPNPGQNYEFLLNRDNCSDIALGHNTFNDIEHNSHSVNSKVAKQGGGFIGFKNFGIGGSGGNTREHSESSSHFHDRSQQILRTGVDCRENVSTYGNIVTNQEDNRTRRYGIDAQVLMNKDDNYTLRHGINSNRRQRLIEFLLSR